MTWSQTSNQLIARAYLKLGIPGEGQVLSASQLSIGIDELNSIIENLHNSGYKEWQLEWKCLSLTASSIVTNNGAIYTCRVSHVASSNTEPGTGSLWHTVWELTGTGGSPWVTGTTYSSIGNFVNSSLIQDILYIWIRDNNTDDVMLTKISDNEYFDISNKFITGKPTSFWIDYTINANKIYLYPQPDKTSYIINYRVINYISDATATNSPNLIKRWYQYLVDSIAYRLSGINRLSLNERSFLKKDMNESFAQAKLGDFNMNISQEFSEGCFS